MSWTCPYEIDSYCKRLNKPCHPGIKGCILKDKVKFLDINDEDSSPSQENLKESTRIE